MFWEVYAIMQNIAEQFRELAHTRQLPTPNEVAGHVAACCGVQPELIFTKTRKREIAEARQLLSTLLKFGLKLSAAQVGIMVGNFDHATVLHGINQVSIRYQVYPKYRDSVDNMIEHLFNADQEHIKARIIDPHLDRKHTYAKLEVA